VRTPAPRQQATRTPARTAGRTPTGRPAGGANRRLMRQRLFVFVIVTLLAAVCIAALQGCHHF
jgi:hypothetical protein